jgi:transcriptional regulator with XRE-family HTH domain
MGTVLLNSIQGKIGQILKVYREKLAINQSVIAKKAGISTSMLSQIEHGAVSPSIDTLFAVCDAIGIEITQVFRSVSEKHQVRIRRPGERLKNSSNGTEYEQLAVSDTGAHPAELFLIEIAPRKQAGLSGQGHEGVEMGYVLAGEAVFVENGVEHLLRQGDSIAFDASMPHSLANTGTVPFRAVWNAVPPHKDYLELDAQTSRR